MSSEKAEKSKPPKGTAPKGGTRYPRYGLKEALEWSKKLVSKTHGGPQPADIIYAAVVDSKGPRGEIKASALKQFGLMDGARAAYVATPLAKSIAIAPPEELQPLLAQAALTPPLFKALFDTFHGDEVSLAKLRQRAAELDVHPDNLPNAASIYATSLSLAGLVTVQGEKVTHGSTPATSSNVAPAGEDEPNAEESDPGDAAVEKDANPGDIVPDLPLEGSVNTPRAVFQVNVNLDASLDTDKLERQLALLKRYGAI